MIPGSHYKHNPLHNLIMEPHAGEISAAKNLNRPEFSMRPALRSEEERQMQRRYNLAHLILAGVVALVLTLLGRL